VKNQAKNDLLHYSDVENNHQMLFKALKNELIPGTSQLKLDKCVHQKPICYLINMIILKRTTYPDHKTEEIF
jgi:hypothetical protein